MPKSTLGKKKKKYSALLPSAISEISYGDFPIQVMYGGGHLFSAGVFRKLGAAALATLHNYFPDPVLLATAFNLPEVQLLTFTDRENLRLFFEKKIEEKPKLSPAAALLCTAYERLSEKLQKEPIEDFRIDFEDGYGYRTSDEEDVHAENSGAQAAIAYRNEELPRFFGIRIKPLTKESGLRSASTLMIFLESFVKQSRGKFPSSFIVTLPKVISKEQLEYFTVLLNKCEKKFQLGEGTLKIELMAEHPDFILPKKGKTLFETAVKICGSRLQSVHIGVYDYLSALGISSQYQDMQHPYCDMLRYELKKLNTGIPVSLSDGVTNLLPVVKYKENAGEVLTQKQKEENRSSIGEGFKKSMSDIMHSYEFGYFRGWDVHPNQLIPRYFSAYYFYLKEFSSNAVRLKNFINQAATAARTGSTFDDAASAFGLLNFFRQGVVCGALRVTELDEAGLPGNEIMNSGYNKILYAGSSDKK